MKKIIKKRKRTTVAEIKKQMQELEVKKQIQELEVKQILKEYRMTLGITIGGTILITYGAWNAIFTLINHKPLDAFIAIFLSIVPVTIIIFSLLWWKKSKDSIQIIRLFK